MTYIVYMFAIHFSSLTFSTRVKKKKKHAPWYWILTSESKETEKSFLKILWSKWWTAAQWEDKTSSQKPEQVEHKIKLSMRTTKIDVAHFQGANNCLATPAVVFISLIELNITMVSMERQRRKNYCLMRPESRYFHYWTDCSVVCIINSNPDLQNRTSQSCSMKHFWVELSERVKQQNNIKEHQRSGTQTVQVRFYTPTHIIKWIYCCLNHNWT